MAAQQLPGHVEPMLARIGAAFDSPQHFFEVKWDGVRAVTYVEHGSHRMHGRRRRDLAGRYPELAFLAGLPSGCVLDGELVVLRADGKPDFPAIVGRENGTAAHAVAAARRAPAVYVVFDLLWQHGDSLLASPWHERRERLQQLVDTTANPRLVLSTGVAGAGTTLFAVVCEQQLEGIVAKRIDARYLPGERTDAWQKIKVQQQVHCVILGYEPDGARDFKSLIVAADIGGELRCVGRVGSGIGDVQRAELRRLLFTRRVPRPLIDTPLDGAWVEAGLYCTVRFLELTASGSLRAPVFVGLVGPDENAGDRA